MDFFLIKTEKGYLPPSEEDLEKSRNVPFGAVIKVNYRKNRSIKNHRRFFALLQVCVENTDMFKSVDEALDYFKFQTGHVEMQTIDGHLMFKPKSISFDEMPEDEFRQFFSRCIDVALTKVVGCKREELLQMILSFL